MVASNRCIILVQRNHTNEIRQPCFRSPASSSTKPKLKAAAARYRSLQTTQDSKASNPTYPTYSTPLESSSCCGAGVAPSGCEDFLNNLHYSPAPHGQFAQSRSYATEVSALALPRPSASGPPGGLPTCPAQAMPLTQAQAIPAMTRAAAPNPAPDPEPTPVPDPSPPKDPESAQVSEPAPNAEKVQVSDPTRNPETPVPVPTEDPVPASAPAKGIARKSSISRGAGAVSLFTEYHNLISSAAEIQVEMVDEGVGGTYFVKTKSRKPNSKNRKLAVFKPGDEEPGALNNPKGYGEDDDNEKGGIKPGDGWVREVIAYQLDHYHFANVPETIEVKMPNRLFQRKDEQKGCKHGSLQKFVQSSDGYACKASCDMGPGSFPTDDVHRMGQLDIRLLNCDRHGGNALVQKDARGGLHLVAIDHSYILPKHAADLDFEWLFWPQSKEPFSSETLAYVAALDPAEDAKVMRKYGIEEECIELMQAATMTLKVGCAQGLSLRTIGRFMRRERMYELSEFENVVNEARQSLEEGGEIEFSRLHTLLTDKLGVLCESPVKAIRDRPVTLKEQVLASGVKAEKLPSSGSYLIKRVDGDSLAVFKSSEARRELNLCSGKDLVSREVAAYRLDDDSYAGVPEAIEMRMPNKLFSAPVAENSPPFTHGSLHRFIRGPVQPVCDVPVESFNVGDVHRIGILDVRLCNADRRCDTLVLTQKPGGNGKLRPTGHAGILPSEIGELRFPWCHWPQAKVPFSDDEVEYVEDLDPDLDAQVLQDLGIASHCIEFQTVATHVLKKAVKLGFTLHQIGLLFERTTLAQPSNIERLISKVRTSLDQGGEVDFDLLKSSLTDWLTDFLSLEDDNPAYSPGRFCSCNSTLGTALGRDPESDSNLDNFSFADKSDNSSFSFDHNDKGDSSNNFFFESEDAFLPSDDERREA